MRDSDRIPLQADRPAAVAAHLPEGPVPERERDNSYNRFFARHSP